MLVVLGAICWPLIGGVTGQVIAIACWLLGFGGALLLLFLEVGLSEDHARARDEELRRNRAEARAAPRRRFRPRWPRRPG